MANKKKDEEKTPTPTDVSVGDYKMMSEDAVEGTIKALGEPTIQATRFGERKRLPVILETPDGQEITVNIWLSPTSTVIRPNSNVGRLLRKLGAAAIPDIVGKKINLIVDNRGFHRFDI